MRDLAPLDRDAVASANVMLYDRALGVLVAEILPLGTYAEPLSPPARRRVGGLARASLCRRAGASCRSSRQARLARAVQRRQR